MDENVTEVGIDEESHPDPDVRMYLTESYISKCPNGCKVYRAEHHGVNVLLHNPTYGCKITKTDILERNK